MLFKGTNLLLYVLHIVGVCCLYKLESTLFVSKLLHEKLEGFN